MYIPQNPHINTMDKVNILPQIRCGIQGPPGVGKTWVAMTFPNPCVLSLDRGLGAHIGRSDIVEVPFYNPEFVDGVFPRTNKPNAQPNRRDALIKWITTEGAKLNPDQTLVLDGGTGVQNAFEQQYNLVPTYSKSGAIDDFALWREKVEYFGSLCELLKTLKCHVVYITHETPDRDKKGELNGKIRPMLTGQFADQLASHFTDYFRMHAITKAQNPEQFQKFVEWCGASESTVREWLKHFGTKQTIYLWQTQLDELCTGCKTSTMIGAPKYIPADYSMFSIYGRKISPPTV